MITRNRLHLLASFGALGLAACGGGGGNDGAGLPQAPAAPQVRVIGQSTFQGNQPNQGGSVAANSLHDPRGNVALTENGTLFIVDAFNGRVLGYRSLPESNNANADFVLGKP